MPNELINLKGPYALHMRRRCVEERKKEKLLYKDRRTLVIRPKHTIIGLLKIIGFYLALYICIGILLICNILIVFYFRVPKDRPLIPKAASLSSVPGVYVGDRKIIRYNSDQQKETAPYIEQLYKFTKPYGLTGSNHLRECNLDDNWGYSTGQPCIILKLNYAVNFRPDTYCSPISLPDKAPNDLMTHLMKLPLGMRFNRIWVGCSFLRNKTTAGLRYVPQRYFDSDCMLPEQTTFLKTPSENLTMERIHDISEYRRLVGIQVSNIPLNQDVILKCSAFAKNIPLEFASVLLVIRVDGVEIPQEVDSDYEDLDSNY